MRIGIDGSRLVGDMSGIGRYVRGLMAPLDAAMPDTEFFVYCKQRATLLLPSPRWQVMYETNPVARALPNVLWAKLRLGTLARRDCLDAFWATNTLMPLRLGNVPTVSTVYDLNHMLVPQSMSLVNRLAHRFWLAEDVRHAQSTVAISHGTASRMRGLLGRAADFIALPGIPLADFPITIDQADNTLADMDVGTPYFLAVGTREPRKNLAVTIEAIHQLRANGGSYATHRLVLAGGKGWGDDSLSRTAPDWVQSLGYVSDVQLAALYTRAAAFVFPSLYEGFGIPVSEALLYGCPVVASDTPELREAGSDDVVYVSPEPEAVAAGLRRALERKRPVPQRPDHDWHSSALVMREALMQAIHEKRTA